MALVGKVGVPVIFLVPVYALDGVTRTAGLAGDLEVQVLIEGDDAGLDVTVLEVATNAGAEYLISFTPDLAGQYAVRVIYEPLEADIQQDVQVFGANVDDLAAVVASHSVVPLDRAPVDTGQIVQLRVTFLDGDGTPFDPFELRMVEIRNHDTDVVVFTIGAAAVDRVSEGVYRVFTPIALADPVTLGDRWFYRARSGDPERSKAFARVVAAQVGADDLLVTVERLKRHELKGASLLDNEGVEIERATFEEAIREATDQIAAELDIKLAPVQVTEKYDYRIDLYQQFGWFELDHTPVRSIDAVVMRHQGTDYTLTFPAAWIQLVNPLFGQFNLVPQTGTLEQWLVANAGGSGALLPVLRPGLHTWWPGLFEITYTVGYTREQVPPRIQKAIALMAAIEVLNIAGEMIIGSGIASLSIGIGGLNQSVSTTSSATNAGHGALIIQYEKQLKELIPAIKRQHHGVSMGVA